MHNWGAPDAWDPREVQAEVVVYNGSSVCGHGVWHGVRERRAGNRCRVILEPVWGSGAGLCR